MKTALVTGASRGLGKVIAAHLRERGYVVHTPSSVRLNLDSENSIMRYVPDFDSLDVLVNNAAVLGETLEEAMAVNAMAPYFLTRTLWRKLSRVSGRVVNISSREGLSTDNCHRFYSVSKAALNAITRMQSRNVDGITVNACCPGWFKSGLGGPHALRTPEEASDTPVWLATEASPYLTGKFFINRQVVPW